MKVYFFINKNGKGERKISCDENLGIDYATELLVQSVKKPADWRFKVALPPVSETIQTHLPLTLGET